MVVNVLDYSNVVIASMQSQSLYKAYEHVNQHLSHYYNYYLVEVR